MAAKTKREADGISLSPFQTDEFQQKKIQRSDFDTRKKIQDKSFFVFQLLRRRFRVF